MKKYLFVNDGPELDAALHTVAGWGTLWRDGTHALVETHGPDVEAALEPFVVAKVHHLSAGASKFATQLPAPLKVSLNIANGGHVTVYDMLAELVPSAEFH
jgi:hypothetical protein